MIIAGLFSLASGVSGLTARAAGTLLSTPISDVAEPGNTVAQAVEACFHEGLAAMGSPGTFSERR
jgi:hypothetical protein